MSVSISKSKYVAGLQCPKLIWTHYNDRDVIPEPDAAKQALFDTGHEVGDLAKLVYPDGIEVPLSRDLAATTAATLDLLKQRVPIFEASFQFDGGYCRADILVPAADGAWDLYEVKSGTSVKDVHVEDIALQVELIEGSGVKLDRLYLMHVNRTYVRSGEIDPHQFFHAEDVTERARALRPEVATRLAAMHETIAGERPETSIGEHCFRPYDCDLWDQCSAVLPEHNVLHLTRIRKKKAFGLIESGVAAIADVPVSDLNVKHLVQQAAVQSGSARVAQDEIRTWLEGLKYPVYCLDFETMNPAVPLVDGTRPYQQVPFQLSLHVIESPGAESTHIEYLAEEAGDPRSALIEALRSIGPEGTVLAYNVSFERGVIRALAEAFPGDADFLASLDRRLQDLMTPFSSFWYYHPDQHGSCSLKAVLPILTDSTYEGMDIAEGGQAQREFQRVVFGDVGGDEKDRVLGALREYCRQDTQAMVDLLEALQGIETEG